MKLFSTLLLCSLACSLLAQEEDALVIDAKHANYNGKTITMDGHVVVEHSLGTMTAEHMVLESIPTAGKNQFGLLDMNDQVCIVFKSGGTLSCAHAIVDYQERTGSFFGGAGGGNVVFTESRRDKKDESAFLIVSSKEMTANLSKDDAAGTNGHVTINDIIAQDHVNVSYNREYMAKSDRAVYQRQDIPGEKSDQALQGKVVMSCDSPERLCEIVTQAGDLVRSVQIHIDTNERLLTLTHPRGTLKAGRESEIAISADRLLWDDNKGILTLRRAVEINQLGIGKLEAEDEVRLIQHTVDGQKIFCDYNRSSKTRNADDKSTGAGWRGS